MLCGNAQFRSREVDRELADVTTEDLREVLWARFRNGP